MHYQSLMELQRGISQVSKSLPRDADRLDFGAKLELSASLLSKIMLKSSSTGYLVIGQTNINKSLNSVYTTVNEMSRIVNRESGNMMSRTERNKLLNAVHARLDQQNELLASHIAMFTQRPEVQEEKPIEQRIRTFSDLAAAFERAKTRKQPATAAPTSFSLESQTISVLNRYKKWIKKLPKRITQKKLGFTTFRAPILAVPAGMVNFHNLELANIKYSRLASGVVLENQLLLGFKPQKRTKDLEKIKEKALDLLEERTNVRYAAAEPLDASIQFSDRNSPLEFIWLVDTKTARALGVPIRLIGFPFERSEAVRKLDFSQAKDQVAEEMREKHPALVEQLEKAENALKAADKIIKHFDTHGEPIKDRFKGEDGEPDPAFYDEYKRNYNKAKRQHKQIYDRFIQKRSAIARRLQRGK